MTAYSSFFLYLDKGHSVTVDIESMWVFGTTNDVLFREHFKPVETQTNVQTLALEPSSKTKTQRKLVHTKKSGLLSNDPYEERIFVPQKAGDLHHHEAIKMRIIEVYFKKQAKLPQFIFEQRYSMKTMLCGLMIEIYERLNQRTNKILTCGSNTLVSMMFRAWLEHFNSKLVPIMDQEDPESTPNNVVFTRMASWQYMNAEAQVSKNEHLDVKLAFKD